MYAYMYMYITFRGTNYMYMYNASIKSHIINVLVHVTCFYTVHVCIHMHMFLCLHCVGFPGIKVQ